MISLLLLLLLVLVVVAATALAVNEDRPATTCPHFARSPPCQRAAHLHKHEAAWLIGADGLVPLAYSFEWPGAPTTTTSHESPSN